MTAVDAILDKVALPSGGAQPKAKRVDDSLDAVPVPAAPVMPPAPLAEGGELQRPRDPTEVTPAQAGAFTGYAGRPIGLAEQAGRQDWLKLLPGVGAAEMMRVAQYMKSITGETKRAQ